MKAATQPTTYAFTRGRWETPAFHLPGPPGSSPSVCVRACPLLFELREGGPTPYVDLPYRMVIAVATLHEVTLYDTQHPGPVAHLAGVHYANINDLSWSGDGSRLAVASSDGYCTFVGFSPGELGQPLAPEKLPWVVREAQETARERMQRLGREAAAAVETVVPINILSVRRKSKGKGEGKNLAAHSAEGQGEQKKESAVAPITNVLSVRRVGEDQDNRTSTSEREGEGGRKEGIKSASHGTEVGMSNVDAARTPATNLLTVRRTKPKAPSSSSSRLDTGPTEKKARRVKPTLVVASPGPPVAPSEVINAVLNSKKRQRPPLKLQLATSAVPACVANEAALTATAGAFG